MEIWKDIKGYEGYYQVSNLGRVKSIERLVRKSTKQYMAKSYILTSALTIHGYYFVALCRNSRCKSKTIHRLMLKAFIPNPKNKKCINHINGIKTDNRLENLEWCTHSENLKHAYKMGLRKNTIGVKLIHNNTTYSFTSLSAASRFLGMNRDYMSIILRNNKTIARDNKKNIYTVLWDKV